MILRLYILISCHFFADFYLQSDKMANKKRESVQFLILHSLIYGIVITAGFLTFTESVIKNIPVIVFLLFFFILTHFTADWLKIKNEKHSKHSEISLFVADQIIHIAVIAGMLYLATYIFRLNYADLSKYENIIKIIFLLIVLIKPSSIFIKTLFISVLDNNHSYSDNCNTDEAKDAGQLIGILERLITTAFLILEQYSAVGLVLTAKSIARFKQLEDKNFAEKYLIGTLVSFSISLFLFMLVKYL